MVTLIPLLLSLAAAAAVSAGLIVILLPLMQRYALARPNARSSHTVPTPQGGGIAVVAAVIVVTDLVTYLDPAVPADAVSLGVVLTMAVVLAGLGAIDDVGFLGVVPRLICQAVAVAAVLAALPESLRIIPALPWWLERGLLFVGILWFVNLVNFMDGLDWMTVAEVVPVTAGLVLFGLMGRATR